MSRVLCCFCCRDINISAHQSQFSLNCQSFEPSLYLNSEQINSEVTDVDMTSIADFYAGRTLFLTGATGFMGKVLLEKLLRSCPAIHRIYVLIRPKRGCSVPSRLSEVLETKVRIISTTHIIFPWQIY